MDVSVVVPLYNEVESLQKLAAWVAEVCEEAGLSWEIVFIDDGSTDGSWDIVQQLSENDDRIKGIKFRRNYGKSAALHHGFQAAKGNVVITMDADLQDNPDEIPDLYAMVMDGNYDLVSGWKKKRHDPIAKTLPSKFFNRTARAVTGIKLHDFNCGLKAYRSDVVKNIEVYGEMHRYIPVIAKQAGFTKIGEKVVLHRKREFGTSKFGLERYINGFLDLISITFISRFGKKPMHLFGTLGTLMFVFGFVVAVWLGARKLYLLRHHITAPLVTQSPYFYMALVAMILGTQLFLSGFLGELISRSSIDRNIYQVDKLVNLDEQNISGK